MSKVLCTRHDHPGGMRLSSLDDGGLRRYMAGHLAGEVACYGESAFCKVTTRHTGHNAEYARRRIGSAAQVIARRSSGSGVLVAARLCGNHGVVHHAVPPLTRSAVPLSRISVLQLLTCRPRPGRVVVVFAPWGGLP